MTSKTLLLVPLFLVAPAVASDPKPDAAPSAAKTFEVELVADLDYYKGADADKIKHKLDLFLPKGHKDFPVLFFVHGGAWRQGDKNFLGAYSSLGRFYARHGIGTVVTNYRLSPKVTHPEHIKDVARAFAWTVKNISKYGGDPASLFPCGHSAGGHLVSLLATDHSYLKAEGIDKEEAIRGVIPISGVYRIPERGMQTVFGKDPKVARLAGPIEHVRAGLPPFRILFADRDLTPCGKVPSEAFCKALEAKKCRASTVEIKDSNHIKIIMSAARGGDPVSDTILAFIAEQTKKR
ncbi:MAG: alpha/beta hydrolase [Planctomycetes bacterium]|nr:alpha/beta hydrolase [Planctomycetota bacterium]